MCSRAGNSWGLSNTSKREICGVIFREDQPMPDAGGFSGRSSTLRGCVRNGPHRAAFAISHSFPNRAFLKRDLSPSHPPLLFCFQVCRFPHCIHFLAWTGRRVAYPRFLTACIPNRESAIQPQPSLMAFPSPVCRLRRVTSLFSRQRSRLRSVPPSPDTHKSSAHGSASTRQYLP